jgi:hypothetical protein
VDCAATADCATTAEAAETATTADRAATAEPTRRYATAESGVTAESRVAVETAAEAWATEEPAITKEALAESVRPAVPPAPAEPRAHADEDPIVEVVGTVVAIRSAGIRVIIVVAVGAGRRTGHVPWTYISRAHSDPYANGSDTYANSYLRISCRASQNHEQDQQTH